jgi:hypothetical protein
MSDLLEKDIKHRLYILIAVATFLRVFVAATLEFSVDEVYYWTYALYPDWSHFDHPPMVGWIIQMFSFNLFFDNELAIRSGAIVFSVLNTLTIYSIGKIVKSPLAGLYAAFLLNTSVYCSILAGSFIIPDTPQLLFWLLSLKYFLLSLPKEVIDVSAQRRFWLACLFAGLAIISKYHGVFILAGAGLYILLFNRQWLKKPGMYVGFLVSVLFTIPILIWNLENNWISMSFHGDRVSNQLVLRFDYFLTEVLGQIAYNNPINYILIVLALVAAFKGHLDLNKKLLWVLLLNSAPIWLVFTSFALFRSTLPHWTGPAFTPLLVVAAVYLSGKQEMSTARRSSVLIPNILRVSMYLLICALFLAWIAIKFYPGTLGETQQVAKYGDKDFTLDMFGWQQIRDGFEVHYQEDINTGRMDNSAVIIAPKYFPGTEIDYYVARPLGIKLLQYGKLSDIHKYAWINRERGQMQEGDNAYMISTSNWYQNPFEHYGENFEQIIPTDTIVVKRSGKLAYYAFVYQMLEYKGNFKDPLEE